MDDTTRRGDSTDPSTRIGRGRRAFLAAAGGVAAATAGCLGFELQSGGFTPPAVVDDRPNAVYVPGHSEGMGTLGRAETDAYAVAVTYSYAHRFWTVTGDDTTRTDAEPDDDVHLMALVWDPETGVVLPETGVEVAIERDGELVSQEVVYPMLSQTMGFHYGGNFSLAGDGSYTVDVTVGAVRTRRTGGFRGRFGEPATLSVGFDYARADRDALPVERFDDRAGTEDALAPTAMGGFPDGKLPPADELPGRLLGTPTSDDATLAATLLDDPPAGVDGDGPYLAVSARTPHNRRVIPAMAVTAAARRDGTTTAETGLTRTLDPELGYHYGATLDVASADEIRLTPTVQPQVARHEGYETAFGGVSGGMAPVTVPVAQ
ncbi:MAG: hypothetical protein J07HB67_00040 [halophilic archaeon J07HB67]|nr:MAG: hypothetical protein J07HB67_00040 [halophilic archaeon J07HB67]